MAGQLNLPFGSSFSTVTANVQRGRQGWRRPWLWHLNYLSAGVATLSQKGLDKEEPAPQAALPGATGLHPGLTQKKKSYGRKQEAQELSGLLSTSCSLEAAKVLQ